jgi:MFS family permease
MCAVVAALALLRPWMGLPDNSGFSLVFLFNGAAFATAGLIALGCAEPADESDGGHLISVRQTFRAAWDVYTHDREFRRASRVAILFMSALLLFPHYQWLGREHLGTSNQDLITWVVAQNISVGIISPLLGMIADRRGNRLVVRLGVFLSALTPLLAVFLASGYVTDGGRWYWLTFVLLGLCPVTMRMLQNYTLELVDEEQHPRYLSTMTVCFAVPFVLAPVFGWLIDLLPYQYPFAAVSVMIAAGGLMTFRMSEPRDRHRT